AMMSVVEGSLVDADVILLVTDIHEQHDESELLQKLARTSAPVVVLINKVDKSSEAEVNAKISYWEQTLQPKAVFAISALHAYNTQAVMDFVLEHLPIHPPYYDKDAL